MVFLAVQFALDRSELGALGYIESSPILGTGSEEASPLIGMKRMLVRSRAPLIV